MAQNITKLRHRFPFRQLRQAFSQYWPVLVLLLVSLSLSFLNFQPGTWQIGWDNLQTELNPPVNLSRTLFAVWEEYQSLGLLGGLAHAADLPRQLLLAVSQAYRFLPNNLIRYSWTFTMLSLGPLGAYFTIRQILAKKFDSLEVKTASLLGALFFLLNLATIQNFFTTFESFSTFYGFFPWLIYLTQRYFLHPTKRNYLLLFLVSFLSAPSFYIETLFVVLTLFLVPHFAELLNMYRLKKSLKVFLAAGVSYFVSQAFWLLPIIFFVVTNGSIGTQAKINLISSPEIYYRNLEYGNINNLALLKGFWFSFVDLAGNNKFDYLMLTWRNHLAQPVMVVLGYLFFGLVLTGIYYSLKKRLVFAKSFVASLLICAFFLLGGGLLINQYLPLIGELFRSPFTKFCIPLAFTYSFFFSIGSIFLLDLFSFLHTQLTYYLTLFTISLALIFYLTPAFTGNLIDPNMRVKVPSEYSALFDFFSKQDPATRIANFPQYTFWGWDYYNWGYRGSGFLWYGIKQPILDRAFDVWEKTSEQYYEEISAALYNENRPLFESLIDKYAINWIVLDKNVIAPDSITDLGNKQLEKILASSSKFNLVENINDTIYIYKTDVDQSVNNFLTVKSPDITFQPFADLSLRPTKTTLDKQQINLSVSSSFPSQSLSVPSFTDSEDLIPVSLSYRKTASGLELKLEPQLPQVEINGKAVDVPITPNYVSFPVPETQSGLILGLDNQYTEVQLPDELPVQSTFYPLMNTYLPSKNNINITLYANTPTYTLDLTSSFASATPYQCYTDKPNRKIEKIVQEQTISLFGTDLVGCLSVPIPQAFTSNQLLSLEFTYWSSTNTPGNAAITDSSLGGEASPQPLIAKTSPSFTRIFTKARTIPLQANLILEANEIKSTQEVNYGNVLINYLPQLGEVNLTLNHISAQQVRLNDQRSNTLSVSVPILDNSLTLSSTIDHSLFSSSPVNCDNFNHTKFDRQIKDGFLYTAVNADSCDQINLKHLPHGLNYAITADSQNLTGLAPTVCLENHTTRRCDVFERLINGQQFIINPYRNDTEFPGFTLHLFNQSFGQVTDQNLIRSLGITPFPLNFIKDITLTGSTAGPQAVSNPVISSTHPAEFIYLVTVTKNSDAPLDLFQTKSPYWLALEVPQADLSLPLWKQILKLPQILRSGSPLNHADNYVWFNSWPLSSGTHHLVIFYLPQYLEFLGLALLPLPIIGVLLAALLKKLFPKKH